MIDGSSLEKDLGLENVQLINDFNVMGYGLLTLRPHEYIVLNDVPKVETAPMAAIGAGSGLGECFLTPGLDGQYTCFACEGGHTDFAPADKTEMELYKDLKAQAGCNKCISVDRIICDPARNDLLFLEKTFPEKVDPKVHDEILVAGTQQSKVVTDNAKTNELCNQTLEIFVDVYGREAGNAMLKYLPCGGFYIMGDLAANNSSYFTKKGPFLISLFDKGRVEPALRACPVYLVLAGNLSERGVNYYACQLKNSL